VATTSEPGSLPSGGDHLSMRTMAKRSSPPSPYGGEDKTIQAMELGARRKAVLSLLHKAGDHPFPLNAGGRGGHQPMWEAKPRLNPLPTTARLMNILEAKHRWKSVAPTMPRTPSRGKTRPVAPAR
jgi:hypothetical protein